MVNNCANSTCGKSLLRLREGRIFIFDAFAGPSVPGAKRLRRLDHYWLCGACVKTMMIVQNAQGAPTVLPRPPVARRIQPIAPVIASTLAF